VALARRSTQRIATSIWPGFVDAITALVLVLFFVLSIFMIVQFVLRDTIVGQEGEIDTLAREIAGLANALGLAQAEAARQEELVATLTADLDTAAGQITEFEAQVAALVARNLALTGERDVAQERLAATETELAAAADELESTRVALASEEERAELAAARQRALEALVESLRQEAAASEATLAARETALAETAEALDEAEAARIAEAAAAELLRERLQGSEAELTALTLSLEEERRRAEETLTLLAAAQAAQAELAAAQEALEASEAAAMTEAERQAALRAQAEALLGQEQEISTEAQRQVALLNQQTAALRQQLDSLQGLLDASREAEAEAEVQIETLGANLNAALARLAAEERARAELEARERERLEAEAQDLQRYRSEFFGRMSEILGAREGVQVVGDRFVFQSEVLFAPGSASLGAAGQQEVARVAGVIRDIADEVPDEIDWILRVDGHTDRIPLSPGSAFTDNWQLSQARALSVVRYMIEAEGVPPDRLAATGFGEYQPIDPGGSPEALARNRRIELKFTER
jgi:chemotaxis protein MotB